jgi:hypothetical protein
MTSGECFENKWFYMKYRVKYLKCGNIFDPWVLCLDSDYVVFSIFNSIHAWNEMGEFKDLKTDNSESTRGLPLLIKKA